MLVCVADGHTTTAAAAEAAADSDRRQRGETVVVGDVGDECVKHGLRHGRRRCVCTDIMMIILQSLRVSRGSSPVSTPRQDRETVKQCFTKTKHALSACLAKMH